MLLKVFNIILDFCFPKLCISCGKVDTYLCLNCQQKKLSLQEAYICHVCGKESYKAIAHKYCISDSELDGVISAIKFNNLSQRLVHEAKYNSVKDLLRISAEIIYKVHGVQIRKLIDEGYKLSFVPMHPARQRQRGYNQAQVLAQELAILLKTNLYDFLQRVQATKQQAKLDKASRLLNLQHAFLVNNSLPKKVLLVDDVFTTGATLEQCALALKQAGSGSIIGITLVRVS